MTTNTPPLHAQDPHSLTSFVLSEIDPLFGFVLLASMQQISLALLWSVLNLTLLSSMRSVSSPAFLLLTCLWIQIDSNWLPFARLWLQIVSAQLWIGSLWLWFQLLLEFSLVWCGSGYGLILLDLASAWIPLKKTCLDPFKLCLPSTKISAALLVFTPFTSITHIKQHHTNKNKNPSDSK